MKKYLVLALCLFACATIHAEEPLTGQITGCPNSFEDSTDSSVSSAGNLLSSKEPMKFWGVFLRSSFENDAYKYGGNVEFEGAVVGKRGFGVDFSAGWGILWDPEFDMANCLFGLGPCYGVKISPACDLFIPAKLMCSVYFDENDETQTNWGVRINPTFLLGKGKCRFAVGAYGDFAEETSFGFTLGLTFM